MHARYKTVFLVIAAVSLIVGVLGLVDLGSAPYGGFFSGPDNRVTRVFPGSPAEAAGLEAGDTLVSIGGIAVSDTRALVQRPRAEIGETRPFVVERDGQRRELQVTYGALPGVDKALGWAGGLIGLCFLAFPLWAYLRKPSAPTTVLALFGLCFGIAFLPGPYTPSAFLRTLGGAFATTVVILGFAFLVHFLMLYPKRRRLMETPLGTKAIYVPAILLAIVFLYVNVVQPDATPALNRVIGLLAGLFIVAFFGWALVAMIQSFARASTSERREYGLTMMLVGTLLGLLPITLSSLIGAAAPAVQANLPGVRFYFLTMLLIPVTLALAAASAPGEPRGG